MKSIVVLASLLVLVACGDATPVSVEPEEGIGSLPLTVISPDENPTTTEKVTLGKLLFWDPVLSGNQDVACATCHHPDHAYADGIAVSQGVNGHRLAADRIGGELVKRNAQTILNTAFNGIDSEGSYDPSDTAMFWDNRSDSLEDQAIEPILSSAEMRGSRFSEDEIGPEILGRLERNQEYRDLFTAAFGSDEINSDRLEQAIAAFERILIANNSRFDQYARGDNNALTAQEVRGLNAFIDAGCNGCHSGPMLSDFELHQLPIAENSSLLQAGIIDDGVGAKFRTPSLRNVELTAPYMHNGTEPTLRSAILFYDEVANPGNDEDLAELDFDDPDDATVDAIEAFLKSLTDQDFDKTIPETVPSGLKVGGEI